MARPFSLAGLLRVRHAQQQKAMAELSQANQRMRDVAERRAGATRVLESAVGSKDVVTDAATLTAIAAARASTRGMIAELDAAATAHRAAAADAQAAYNEARARAVALEKLEERHDVAARAEELRQEQIALDEIATSARFRSSASRSSASRSPASNSPEEGLV
jgi:flagellar FliJ protein